MCKNMKRMINKSININKTNTQITENSNNNKNNHNNKQNKNATYDFGNLGPSLGQAQTLCEIKPFNGLAKDKKKETPQIRSYSKRVICWFFTLLYFLESVTRNESITD